MARRNRTGTTLTVREVRNAYPGLDMSVLYVIDDEGDGGHDEIEAPGYTARPCGCVAGACPACRPSRFDADGNFTGPRPLWHPRTGNWTA